MWFQCFAVVSAVRILQGDPISLLPTAEHGSATLTYQVSSPAKWTLDSRLWVDLNSATEYSDTAIISVTGKNVPFDTRVKLTATPLEGSIKVFTIVLAPIDKIEVQTTQRHIFVGDSDVLSLAAWDARSNRFKSLNSILVRWKLDDQEIIAFEGSSEQFKTVVSGLKRGVTKVWAILGTLESPPIELTVKERLQISPSAVTLPIGSDFKLLSLGGRGPIALTPFLMWYSSVQSVALTDYITGRLLALSPGNTKITLRDSAIADMQASANISVTSPSYVEISIFSLGRLFNEASCGDSASSYKPIDISQVGLSSLIEAAKPFGTVLPSLGNSLGCLDGARFNGLLELVSDPGGRAQEYASLDFRSRYSLKLKKSENLALEDNPPIGKSLGTWIKERCLDWGDCNLSKDATSVAKNLSISSKSNINPSIQKLIDSVNPTTLSEGSLYMWNVSFYSNDGTLIHIPENLKAVVSSPGLQILGINSTGTLAVFRPEFPGKTEISVEGLYFNDFEAFTGIMATIDTLYGSEFGGLGIDDAYKYLKRRCDTCLSSKLIVPEQLVAEVSTLLKRSISTVAISKNESINKVRNTNISPSLKNNTNQSEQSDQKQLINNESNKFVYISVDIYDEILELLPTNTDITKKWLNIKSIENNLPCSALELTVLTAFNQSTMESWKNMTKELAYQLEVNTKTIGKQYHTRFGVALSKPIKTTKVITILDRIWINNFYPAALPVIWPNLGIITSKRPTTLAPTQELSLHVTGGTGVYSIHSTPHLTVTGTNIIAQRKTNKVEQLKVTCKWNGEDSFAFLPYEVKPLSNFKIIVDEAIPTLTPEPKTIQKQGTFYFIGNKKYYVPIIANDRKSCGEVAESTVSQELQEKLGSGPYHWKLISSNAKAVNNEETNHASDECSAFIITVNNIGTAVLKALLVSQTSEVLVSEATVSVYAPLTALWLIKNIPQKLVINIGSEGYFETFGGKSPVTSENYSVLSISTARIRVSQLKSRNYSVYCISPGVATIEVSLNKLTKTTISLECVEADTLRVIVEDKPDVKYIRCGISVPLTVAGWYKSKLIDYLQVAGPLRATGPTNIKIKDNLLEDIKSPDWCGEEEIKVIAYHGDNKIQRLALNLLSAPLWGVTSETTIILVMINSSKFITSIPLIDLHESAVFSWGSQSIASFSSAATQHAKVPGGGKRRVYLEPIKEGSGILYATSNDLIGSVPTELKVVSSPISTAKICLNGKVTTEENFIRKKEKVVVTVEVLLKNDMEVPRYATDALEVIVELIGLVPTEITPIITDKGNKYFKTTLSQLQTGKMLLFSNNSGLAQIRAEIRYNDIRIVSTETIVIHVHEPFTLDQTSFSFNQGPIIRGLKLVDKAIENLSQSLTEAASLPSKIDLPDAKLPYIPLLSKSISMPQTSKTELWSHPSESVFYNTKTVDLHELQKKKEKPIFTKKCSPYELCNLLPNQLSERFLVTFKNKNIAVDSEWNQMITTNKSGSIDLYITDTITKHVIANLTAKANKVDTSTLQLRVLPLIPGQVLNQADIQLINKDDILEWDPHHIMIRWKIIRGTATLHQVPIPRDLGAKVLEGNGLFRVYVQGPASGGQIEVIVFGKTLLRASALLTDFQEEPAAGLLVDQHSLLPLTAGSLAEKRLSSICQLQSSICWQPAARTLRAVSSLPSYARLAIITPSGNTIISGTLESDISAERLPDSFYIMFSSADDSATLRVRKVAFSRLHFALTVINIDLQEEFSTIVIPLDTSGRLMSLPAETSVSVVSTANSIIEATIVPEVLVQTPFPALRASYTATGVTIISPLEYPLRTARVVINPRSVGSAQIILISEHQGIISEERLLVNVGSPRVTNSLIPFGPYPSYPILTELVSHLLELRLSGNGSLNTVLTWAREAYNMPGIILNEDLVGDVKRVLIEFPSLRKDTFFKENEDNRMLTNLLEIAAKSISNTNLTISFAIQRRDSVGKSDESEYRVFFDWSSTERSKKLLLSPIEDLNAYLTNTRKVISSADRFSTPAIVSFISNPLVSPKYQCISDSPAWSARLAQFEKELWGCVLFSNNIETEKRKLTITLVDATGVSVASTAVSAKIKLNFKSIEPANRMININENIVVNIDKYYDSYTCGLSKTQYNENPVSSLCGLTVTEEKMELFRTYTITRNSNSSSNVYFTCTGDPYPSFQVQLRSSLFIQFLRSIKSKLYTGIKILIVILLIALSHFCLFAAPGTKKVKKQKSTFRNFNSTQIDNPLLKHQVNHENLAM